ncbi:carbohydrate sulfotransferase 6 [Denticeps clupeoides]|uniref:Sulfotransferase n=1 Tax=Denticeps clupeoides TaxID=299321 RepID=A0AAY4BAD8_9TELE|nr:carbohydrate sulfotransferase 6-like [Denticeps clupeoides]
MLRCRLTMPALLTLVLLQGVTMVLFFGWYSHLIPVPGSARSHSKVHVLLLSSWRSGSSFLGQVFSQHPSVFYLMEPGWHVWSTLRMPGARGLRMAVRDLLRSVLRCDLSVMDSYLPPSPNVSQLFMWSHSRALCSPPACGLTPRGGFSNQTACSRRCDARGLARVEEACRAHSHVVLKEVRVFELESLYPLLRDPALDLRVVHLVRDPRAVARSREQSAKALLRDNALVLEQGDARVPETQYQVMQEVCRSHVRIHETAVLKSPDFLEGRYKMVRYEDVVRDPLAEIEAMYRFVGLEMTDELQEWIYRITHGKGKGTKKEAFQITSRNAEDVSRAWRTSLSFDKVQRIQNVCKSAMSLLGYRLVESEAEQHQLDVDVLGPRKALKFTWLPSKTTQRSTRA